jgi:hypothetical protein
MDDEPITLPKLPPGVRGPARKFHEFAKAELERRRTSGAELDEQRYDKAVRLVLRKLGVTPEDEL